MLWSILMAISVSQWQCLFTHPFYLLGNRRKVKRWDDIGSCPTTWVFLKVRASMESSTRCLVRMSRKQPFWESSTSFSIRSSRMTVRRAMTGSWKLKSLSLSSWECFCHFLYTAEGCLSTTDLKAKSQDSGKQEKWKQIVVMQILNLR